MRAKEFIVELNMAPGNLQKEVNRLISSAAPQFGMEMEMLVDDTVVSLVADNEMNNEEITVDTSYRDVMDEFSDFENGTNNLSTGYQEWLGEKIETAMQYLTSMLDEPNIKKDQKIDIMVYADDVIPEEVGQMLVDLTGDEKNRTYISRELATKIISQAQNVYKKEGVVSSWDTDEIEDPYAKIYHEMFQEDNNVELRGAFYVKYEEDFEDEPEYSMGSFLLYNDNTTMNDVFCAYDHSECVYDDGDHGGEIDASDLQGHIENIAGEKVMVTFSPGSVDTSTYWTITTDASITAPNGTAGIELITPILEYESGIKTVKKVIDYLTSDLYATTNDSTGLHINVSMKKIDHNKLDYVKLILLLGDNHVLKLFDREFTSYAKGSLDQLSKILTKGVDNTQSPEKITTLMTGLRKNVSDGVKNSIGSIRFGKHTSVGIKSDRIEFRSAGGVDYLENFDKIVQTLNRFIVAYAAAADPNAYRKEYAKKLYKVATSADNGNPNAIKLFAGFNSGMISKERLISNLQHMAEKRAEVAAEEPKEINAQEN